MSISRIIQQAAAGNAGEAVYVDDVFSTYLYEGNGSTQTITNGIDLAGEGGLVWTKARTSGWQHALFDTERGSNKRIGSNTASPETTWSDTLTAFNSNGFSLGADSTYYVNKSGDDYASWTFRKQPGFFDVVTYTGNGTTQTINHSLGSVPGMIIVKSTSGSYDWAVYHRGVNGGTNSEQYGLYLNTTQAQQDNDTLWNDTAPTSTQFSVGKSSGASSSTNANGATYVAYLFAHDAQDFGTDSDEAIIKCGTIAANGSETLGFEPQWLLTKKYDGSAGWTLVDSMRRFDVDGSNYVQANTSGSEATNGLWKINSNGFSLGGGSGNYIYVAIRRPHKPAEEFDPEKLLATPSYYTSGDPVFQLINASTPIDFTIDMAITRHGGAVDDTEISSRLTQGKLLYTNTGAAETLDFNMMFDYSNGYHAGVSGPTSNMVGIGFRRAPGFFDVVTYTGNGTGQDIPHNLGVAPEMMWIKRRNYDYRWVVYYPEATNRGYLELHTNVARTLNPDTWNETAPTATHFTVGTDFSVNHTHPYIAYLFATVPGISKVGSYTGTGSEQTIDCGFTAGSNFVMIKRTDSTGNWWYASDRYVGVNYNNSRLYAFNNEERDYVTQGLKNDATGFTVQASNSNTNVNGATYIFYAIA